MISRPMKRSTGPILPALIVVAAAVAVVLYAGLQGWSVSRSGSADSEPTDARSTPLGSIMEPINPLPLSSEPPAAHVDSLPMALRPVLLDELMAISGERTIRQALPDLRPYWIQFTHGRFRVDVTGQLVDEDALDRIRVGSVGRLRLLFDPVEPYWTLRIDFR